MPEKYCACVYLSFVEDVNEKEKNSIDGEELKEFLVILLYTPLRKGKYSFSRIFPK